MKILILSFYYYPDLSACSFRTKVLVNELLKQSSKEIKIELITTIPNRYSSFIKTAPRFESHSNLTIHRVSIPSHKSGIIDQSIAFMIFAFKVILLTKNKEYDLIVATSSRLMTASLGAYISKKQKRPLYIDFRDILVDQINDILPRKISWIVKPIFSFLEKWTVNSSKKINLVSLGFLPYFKDRYPSKQYSFFTNGIDEEFVKAQPKYSFDIKSRILTVVYAGNIGVGQGLHSIIPELGNRFIGKLNFKIIGGGSQKNELIEKARSMGSNNIEILSPVDRKQLLKIYEVADILFLHLNDNDSLKKVLPSKLFEYAALGKPIWAGVDGYSAKFIREYIDNSAVFYPSNADEAEKSFKMLKMNVKPRNNFVKQFSRLKIMEEMAIDIINTT